MTSTTSIYHPLYEDQIVLPFKDVQSYHLKADEPQQAGYVSLRRSKVDQIFA